VCVCVCMCISVKIIEYTYDEEKTRVNYVRDEFKGFHGEKWHHQ